MTTAPRLTTPLTELTGVTHPVVQTAMGWVSDTSLVVAAAEAGALGFIASAMMSLRELEEAIVAVKERTDKPFGVNLRADATDAAERSALLIKHKVRVAGFAMAPKRELIEKLKSHDVLVVPSVGAARHAEKVAGWGADMVMVQGGEGGGHTGGVATSLLLPAVIDAVDIPVIAAGGYYDGRGLAAALAYGAVGVGMGTRFLMTQECTVPEATKQVYLSHGLDDTVVTRAIDGVPIRILRTGFAERIESKGASVGLGTRVRNVLDLKRESGTSWFRLVRDGISMKFQGGRSITQTMSAANTPMLMRIGLHESDTDKGILASGQVVGAIHDIPTCAELVERTVRQAVERIEAVNAARVV
ncbi:NAD(P)H-dependent flavin oxidoreductase [Microbacterium sp. No. 7]|uniref:NAD(P)H-dependent flavin oxidoreductase n=1 Tax=Microbacterium sp. No. 7 TaxID=1714373 RepID=UPI0006D2B215|nr:nitronate monooxygenase [Microbacterium sp. No. 7]ALJ22168.1 2-nitropropane dioxygenase [Microbacterium sp. No. 7]